MIVAHNNNKHSHKIISHIIISQAYHTISRIILSGEGGGVHGDWGEGRKGVE